MIRQLQGILPQLADESLTSQQTIRLNQVVSDYQNDSLGEKTSVLDLLVKKLLASATLAHCTSELSTDKVPGEPMDIPVLFSY